jgi:hypothetical protein
MLLTRAEDWLGLVSNIEVVVAIAIILPYDRKQNSYEVSPIRAIDDVVLSFTDRRVIGLIKAFLAAGVRTELGELHRSVIGTPQGGIASPLFANLALAVLDEPFEAAWAATSRYRFAASLPAFQRCRHLPAGPVFG